MDRGRRLRRRKEFAAAYRRGRAHGNQLLVIRVVPNGTEVTRFGFVTGKGIGSAVVRNRVKRRLREAARQMLVQGGWDIVIGARKGAAEAPFSDLLRSLGRLMARAGVLEHRAPAADAGEDA